MATNIFSNITVKAIEGLFMEVMGKAPNIFRNHCMIQNSTSPQETYSWLGTLPVPREFLNARSFQGLRDFTVTLVNNTYEMSFIVQRNTLEDDSLDQIKTRITEVAEVWATFDDSLFATLLEAGASSTDTFDGTTFFDDTRTIGSSAAIDNDRTSAISDDNAATATEVGLALEENLSAMWVYEDDQGRPSFNAQAMGNLRVIIHPQYLRGFTEFLNSSLLSNSDNPWGKGLVEIDVLPYLTASDITYYLSALGATRKPYIYQERTATEVMVYNDAKDVAENDGLMVLSRKRLRFGYGDPRRALQHVFT